MRAGISSRRSSTRAALLAKVLASAADGRRGPGRRGLHPSRTSSRRTASKRFTVAALDLGIKAMTPKRMAERGIEVHVLPATATLEEVLRGRAGRRLLLQRSGRPGDHRPPDRPAARRAGRGMPVLRHLLRQPGPRPGARPRHVQAEVRPPRHQPAGARPGHRQGRDHRAEPRVRRRRAARPETPTTPYGRAEVSHVCLNDDVVEGLSCVADGRCRRSRCSTTRRRRPARTTRRTCSTGSSSLMEGRADA